MIAPKTWLVPSYYSPQEILKFPFDYFSMLQKLSILCVNDRGDQFRFRREWVSSMEHIKTMETYPFLTEAKISRNKRHVNYPLI